LGFIRGISPPSILIKLKNVTHVKDCKSHHNYW